MSVSFELSFIPPCAKFGRPPPLAPVARAISPTILPACIPRLTNPSDTLQITVLLFVQ